MLHWQPRHLKTCYYWFKPVGKIEVNMAQGIKIDLETVFFGLYRSDGYRILFLTFNIKTGWPRRNRWHKNRFNPRDFATILNEEQKTPCRYIRRAYRSSCGKQLNSINAINIGRISTEVRVDAFMGKCEAPQAQNLPLQYPLLLNY